MMPEKRCFSHCMSRYSFLLCVCVHHLSGRPPWGSAMAVSALAAGDQAEGGSATRRRPQPLPAEKERAGRDQEDLGEQELRCSRGSNSTASDWLNKWLKMSHGD